MIKRKGQSSLEYIALVTILIGALVAIGNYFKRGLQGRWKAATDDLGDQYDPRITNSDMMHRIQIATDTRITTVNAAIGNGIWTIREDQTNTIETKTGFTTTGGY